MAVGSTPHARRIVRPVLLAGVLASSLALGMGGADAATAFHRDPSGDVVVTGAPGVSAVRDVEAADLVGFGVAYDATTLRVATSLRAYRTLDGVWEATVRTSQGFVYRLRVSLDGSTPPRLRRSLPGGSGLIDRTCDGLVVARTERGITARIPTSCVGGAWRVRVGVRTEATRPSSGDPAPAAAEFTDDALADGRASAPAPVRSATLGRWLEQG